MTARATARWAGTLEFTAAGRSLLIRDQAVTVYQEPATPVAPGTTTGVLYADSTAVLYADNTPVEYDS